MNGFLEVQNLPRLSYKETERLHEPLTASRAESLSSYAFPAKKSPKLLASPCIYQTSKASKPFQPF